MAASNLALSISILREASQNHASCLQAIDIILSLSKQWSIRLPAGLQQEAIYHSRTSSFASADGHRSSYFVTPSSASTYSSPLEQGFGGDTNVEMPYYVTAYGASGLPPVGLPQHQQNDLFWSLFPDQSVPLQAVPHNGPMNISVMVDMPNDDRWDQLNKDGFKVADVND